MHVFGLNIPRMTPGALRLRFLQRFGHGLRVAYYRDIVRPRILHTPPISGTTDKTAEIHVLTSAGDWLNLMWTLKSFYAISPKKYALCIHADKSLLEQTARTLEVHFPDARVIRRAEADAKAAIFLKNHPRCLTFRNTNLLAPKVFDSLAFLESARMALFDSDLMFFAEPKEYIRRIEDPAYRLNSFNPDVVSGYAVGYTVEPETVRAKLGFDLHPRINSGFGLIQRDSMPLDWIEEFLDLPGLLEGHFWRIEQTVFALCASRFGVELLPDEYTLYFAPGLGNRAFRHYNSAFRHLMYGEGIRKLVKNGFLQRTTI